MRKHGNTLYITTHGSRVTAEGKNIIVSCDTKESFRIPIHNVESIVNFGNVIWTPSALGLCGENKVGVVFLSEWGKFLSRSQGATSGNIFLRRAQFKKAANRKSTAEAAVQFVYAKICNVRSMLQRAVRDHRSRINTDEVNSAVLRLSYSLRKLKNADNLALIRGIEGEAAKISFAVYDNLLLAQKQAFFFHERNRRPPADRFNALLSFIYTLLSLDTTVACEAVGLDPQMGFLHADRSGRPSLALDLMEELRPYLADRLAFSLVNRLQVEANGFFVNSNNGIWMTDDTRKTVLKAWQERKSDTIIHPFLNEKITIGLLPLIQARLLAKWCTGSLTEYPAFFVS